MSLLKPGEIVLTSTVRDLNRPKNILLNEANTFIEIKPTDELLALLAACNFVQRGKMSWAISTSDDNMFNIKKFLTDYTANFLPFTMFSLNDQPYSSGIDSTSDTFFQRVENLALYDDYNRNRVIYQPAIQQMNNATVSYDTEFARELRRIYNFREAFGSRHKNEWNIVNPFEAARATHQATPGRRRGVNQVVAIPHRTPAAISVELKNNLLWVRLYIMSDVAQNTSILTMNKTRNVVYPTLNALKPSTAANALRELEKKCGVFEIDEEKSATALSLIEMTKDVVSVGYVPNEPAKVYLNRGENVLVTKGSELGKFAHHKEHVVSLTKVLSFKQEYHKVEFMVHPALEDIVNMSAAKPFEDDALKNYQKEAVGLHLATSIGYLNAISPGLGKTVITLVSMRERAKKVENYRALVVCEANVRDQWVEESEKWFPAAKVVKIDSGADVDSVIEALAYSGPSIIVMSYSHSMLVLNESEKREDMAMRTAGMEYDEIVKLIQEKSLAKATVGSLLLDTRWNDLCADEAVVIRNGSSKQNTAMWILRANADLGVALTGTPINKSPDDIARLLAWARNDRYLFSGKKLSDQYDATNEKDAKKLFRTFGPLVFRRDTSEAKGEMPEPLSSVTLLTPTPAEKALASAAERELKRCYMELLTALEDMEGQQTGSQKDEVTKAKDELKAARGAWLGGTQLARMSTSDPSTLLASESVGAALLVGQGLVHAALADEPTKRREFIKQAHERIRKGQQILVFTEFATVAMSLVEALNNNGIKAKAYTGKNSTTRDKSRTDFQNGELDVLVCTKAGERGLTLHKASAIYHYDIPWTIERVIQRTGRGIRIGSENATVEVIFLILDGTIEQRMAGHIVTQAAQASLILDKSRGIDIKNTEITGAMKGLIGSVTKTSDKDGLRKFGALLGFDEEKPKRGRKKAEKKEPAIDGSMFVAVPR